MKQHLGQDAFVRLIMYDNGMQTCDFLVIGGGVVGLSIARELKRRHRDADILLLEKEVDCGAHASGRNSGVLHAGFYYTADSLKAKLTREGNRRLKEFCTERSIPVRHCGKLVLPRNEAEDGALTELFKRAKANGVDVAEVDEKTAREIEPRAKVLKRALWSPTTASTDPRLVTAALRADAEAAGVIVHAPVAWLGTRAGVARTSIGDIDAGFVVNAAGLQADYVASAYGFSQTYAVLPFKGLYLYSDESPGALRTNVYPVPDPKLTFLGVHFTVAADGKMKIGPTAIPALWREHYGGLSRFSASEFARIAVLQARLMLTSDWDFHRLAWDEIRKQSRSRMVELASSLVEGVERRHYQRWGKPGLRAQLIDVRSGRLVNDFIIEGDEKSLHVLNAISPGFTCCLPFADLVCDRIAAAVGSQRR